MRYIICLLILFNASAAQAKRKHHEKYYQEKYCAGQLEFVLEDRARVDCLTKSYAFEYDFSDKWAESLGQSLYYSARTGRQPAIALILENPKKDAKYVRRLREAIKYHKLNIHLVLIEDK
jgi:hypothetical protein